MYGFALDARAWDLFDRVFTQDVEAVFGPAGAGWVGLDVFKESFAEFHDTLDSHVHTMMGQLVHVDGDTANAFSYGNWLLVRHAAEGGLLARHRLLRRRAGPHRGGLAHQAPGLPPAVLERQPVGPRAAARAPARHDRQGPAPVRRGGRHRVPPGRHGQVALP